MGAPRLQHDEKAAAFREKFQQLVPYKQLSALAEKSKVSLRTLQTWHVNGTSQPYSDSLTKVAEALGIDDPIGFFYGPLGKPEQASNTPEITGKQPAPKWMHDALDDAYSSPYSDFVHFVVTWAAKNQARTGT